VIVAVLKLCPVFLLDIKINKCLSNARIPFNYEYFGSSTTLYTLYELIKSKLEVIEVLILGHCNSKYTSFALIVYSLKQEKLPIKSGFIDLSVEKDDILIFAVIIKHFLTLIIHIFNTVVGLTLNLQFELFFVLL
jgi:hypothetical protein